MPTITTEMKNAINELFDGMAKDFNTLVENEVMRTEFKASLSYTVGEKYIRITHRNSAWGFIVNVDDDKKFKYGALLKPAGFGTPTRNFARGNIFNLKNYIRYSGC